MQEVTRQMKLLGLKVRDRVTGFEGVVTSIGFDLYGCVQAIVSPFAGEKGELKDSRWFDTSRLVVTDKTPVMDLPAWMPKPLATASSPSVRGPESKPAMSSNPIR